MYVNYLKLWTLKIQMAKEHVKYVLIGNIEYALIQIVRVSRNICLCDIDNNWVMLLFTSCTSLTFSLKLVGGMCTCEADPSQL